jgi:hypothetical protein
MDQADYNRQAVDWRHIRVGSDIAVLEYGVPFADVVTYVTEAIQDPDPWYINSSPYGGPIVPPGYFYGEYLKLLVVPNYPMGVLNSQLSFESSGPVLHGERVAVIGRIERIYEKRGRPYMDLRIIVRKADGSEPIRGLVTLLLELEEVAHESKR